MGIHEQKKKKNNCSQFRLLNNEEPEKRNHLIVKSWMGTNVAACAFIHVSLDLVSVNPGNSILCSSFSSIPIPRYFHIHYLPVIGPCYTFDADKMRKDLVNKPDRTGSLTEINAVNGKFMLACCYFCLTVPYFRLNNNAQ